MVHKTQSPNNFLHCNLFPLEREFAQRLISLVRTSHRSSFSVGQSIPHDSFRKLRPSASVVPLLLLLMLQQLPNRRSRLHRSVDNIRIVGHSIQVSWISAPRQASWYNTAHGAVRLIGRLRSGDSRLAHCRTPHGILSGCHDASSSCRDRSTDCTASTLSKTNQACVSFIAQIPSARSAIVLVLAHLVSIIAHASTGPRGSASHTACCACAPYSASFFHCRCVVEVARWRVCRYCAGRKGSRARLADSRDTFEAS